MQFTWGSIGVAGATSETVRTELIYQIERISHHASAVILDGCNECGGGGLTESFVMPTVASVDQSRAVWPSCPASGWASGVDRLVAPCCRTPQSMGTLASSPLKRMQYPLVLLPVSSWPP